MIARKNISAYLTCPETAERLGLTDGRIRQLLLGGLLKGDKFGNSWAIPQSEVERFAKLERPAGRKKILKKSD